MPEPLRIVEEVRAHRAPRVLRRDGEDLALVAPLPRQQEPPLKKPAAADLAAFRYAAGTWADLNIHSLIETIYRAAGRDAS